MFVEIFLVLSLYMFSDTVRVMDYFIYTLKLYGVHKTDVELN